MTAYALAHLERRQGPLHPDILMYLRRVRGTLDPYQGRFLVHGSAPEVKEGPWHGDLVLISFPTLARARDWYDCPAYKDIVRLRTDHLRGAVILMDGVDSTYDPAQMAEALGTA